MKIEEAQDRVDALIEHYGGYWKPLSMYARLVEEVGELGRAMNIKYGDKKSKSQLDGKAMEEELSDVFFTILAISKMAGIDLATEFEDKVEKDWEKCKGVYD